MSIDPMLHDQDIICLSSIDWDFIWQGHQEVMSTFAKHGNRVLFVENTGIRTPNVRDLPRLAHRIRNWLRGTKGFRQEQENLFVYSPLILPFPYSRIARWINRALLLKALQRWMRAVGSQRPIVWTFLPTPLVRDLIRELDPKLTVYYCIDDLASSSPGAQRITQSEDQLFREADLVFVTSNKLRERAQQFREQVSLFPFGVAFETFDRVRQGPDDVPQDLRVLHHPIVGYVGGIHQWVDQEFLAHAARSMRETSFVLIGPCQTDVSRLAHLPNVHLLGGRLHDEVPRYVKGFDVGIVPYRPSDYTAHVYPTKLNEYLAMGIPVVATDLPEIRRFNAEHGTIVTIAKTAEEFVDGLRAVLRPATAETIQRRIEVAGQNSWSARIAQMSALMDAQLALRATRTTPWTESLLRLYRSARRRIVTIAVPVVAAYLLVFQSPLIWWLAEPLHMVEPARPVDAIVVFAGGVGESGKAGEGYRERVKQAVELYQAGMAPRIVFSSGYAFIFQEAEVMKALAMAEGVPASVIILEEYAANTFENVTRVRGILDHEGCREILLVSSPFHMRRAVWTWRKQTPHIGVIPVPVTESQFYAHTWGARPAQIHGILHEYLGIVYYWLKGWI